MESPPGPRTAEAPRRSLLEPYVYAELPVLGVIERSEVRRREVRLHVGRQEGAKRIGDAHSEPRVDVAEGDPPVEAQFGAYICGKPALVTRSDELEILVHDGVGQTAADVERAEEQPSRGGHRLAAQEQPIRHVRRSGRVLVLPDDRFEYRAIKIDERVQIFPRL